MSVWYCLLLITFVEGVGLELGTGAGEWGRSRRACNWFRPRGSGWIPGARRRRPTQGEHLIQRTLVGDEPDADEVPARPLQLSRLQRQQSADRGVTVVAQALRVSDSDQQQVQRQGRRAAALEATIADQALVYPTEVRRHPAQPLRAALV